MDRVTFSNVPIIIGIGHGSPNDEKPQYRNGRRNLPILSPSTRSSIGAKSW